MFMRKNTVVICVICALIFLGVISYLSYQGKKQVIKPADKQQVKASWWDFQSIDTMKYSRDLAREKLNDISFDETIDTQVKNIADTGANYVAIATPYDAEFLPYLKRWEAAARKYNLNVWYRGNWSGWEGWFDYPKITRTEHIAKSVQFIKDNPDLFKSGDIFSACPECENGGPGDPRLIQDIEGHRQFLIDEFKAVGEIFRIMGKNVQCNFSPMNGDIAKIIMDPDTTKALGGVVVVDHYVPTGTELARDLKDIASISKGKIVLGEFGAPIPDLQPNFTEQDQAKWIADTLDELTKVDSLIGVNYWVANGGSTKLWNDDETARPAVSELTAYFKPQVVQGTLINEINEPITKADVVYKTHYIDIDTNGVFTIKDNKIDGNAVIFSNEYEQKQILLDESHPNLTIVLKKNNEDLIFTIRKFLYQKFGSK